MSGNCLDLIFIDAPDVVVGIVVSLIGISDHCYVSDIIKTEQAVPDISFFAKFIWNHKLIGIAFELIFASLTGQISIDKLTLLPWWMMHLKG